MAELFDTQTKERIDVPDADAPNAVLSGRYGLDGTREVVLFDPDGKSWTMPTASAVEAFRQGYTYGPQTEVASKVNEDRFGTFGAKLLAGGAAAARGATLGLADRALRNIGVEAQTLRDLDEGEPLTSTIAEVGGGIASVALTGGASGAGRAVAAGATKAAGKNLLKRAGAKALELGFAGGVEGAAFGAGHAVSEDALGRADLTAESLIANSGLGALVGVGGGALIGGGGTLAVAGVKKGAEKVAEKLTAGSLKEWLEDFAGERALKATLGQQKRAFTQLEDKGLADKAKKYILEEIGIDKFDNTESIAPKLAAKRDGLTARLDDMVTKLDDSTAGQADEVSRLADDVPAAQGKLESAKKALDEALEAESKAAAHQRTYGDSIPDEVTKAVAAARKGVAKAERAAKSSTTRHSAGESALQRVRGEVIADRIESEIVANIDPIAQKGTRDAIQKAADGYRSGGPMPFSKAAEMRRAAQKNANYDAAVPKPTQQAWADVAKIWNNTIDEAAEPVLKGMGEQTDRAYRALREEFSLVQRLTDYAENRVQGNAAVRWASPSDHGMGAAAALMTGDPVTGFAAGVGNKILRERGNAFAANIAYKLSRLQAIQKASQATASRVDDVIASFLERASQGTAAHAAAPATTQILLNTSFMPKSAAAKAPTDRRDAAKQRAREIAELANDPQKMADRIAMSLSGVDESAPGISGQAAITATRAVQHLAAKAPKNHKSVNTLQPLIDDWRPTDQEVAKFERHVRAAMEPLSALTDLGAGMLTPEAAETFRELYPQLHQMTFAKLTEKLSEMKDKLPYVDRVNLSLLFGAPVDDSMRPDFISRTQAMWAQKPQANNGRSAGNPGNLDMASNMRSMTQKLEEKR